MTRVWRGDKERPRGNVQGRTREGAASEGGHRHHSPHDRIDDGCNNFKDDTNDDVDLRYDDMPVHFPIESLRRIGAVLIGGSAVRLGPAQVSVHSSNGFSRRTSFSSNNGWSDR